MTKTPTLLLAMLMAGALIPGETFSQATPNSNLEGIARALGPNVRARVSIQGSGTRVSIHGFTFASSAGSTADVAVDFQRSSADLFPLPSTSRLVLANTVNTRGKTHLIYYQMDRGKRVYGGDFSVSVNGDNAIYRVDSHLYQDVLSQPAILSAQQASGLVADRYSLRHDLPFEIEPVTLPVSGGFHDGYIVSLRGYSATIDGVLGEIIGERGDENGTFLREDRIAFFPSQIPAITEHVRSMPVVTKDGHVFPKTMNTSSITVLGLKKLKGIGDVLDGTNVRVFNQLFNSTSASSGNPVPDSASNEFKYSQNPTTSDDCITLYGGNRGYDGIDCSHMAASNAYYHAETFYTTYLNGDLGWSQPQQLTALIGVGGRGAASASFDNGAFHLNFGNLDDPNEGGMLENPAFSDDVIYHEYAHLMTRDLGISVGSNLETRAIFEGLSDYFSSSFLGDPIFGEGWVRCTGDALSTSSTCGGAEETYLRSLSSSAVLYHYDNFGGSALDFNVCEFQVPSGEGYSCNTWILSPGSGAHINGVILGSALWDLRNATNISQTDQLLFDATPALNGTDEDFLDVLDVMLARISHQ